MALRTALVVSGDTGAAQRALAELDQSIDRVEKSTGEATGEFVKASVGLERLRVAQEQAARSGVTLSAEQQRLAIHGRDLSVQQAATGQAMQRGTQMAGAQRAGMQQLSFQLNDVATMFAMGARPMQIFASQSGQVVQAVQLMSGSSRGFMGLLAGPWGIAITSAITVLGSLGMAYLSSADNADAAVSRLDEALRRFRAGLQNTTALSDVMEAATSRRSELLLEEAAANRQLVAAQAAIDRGPLDASSGADAEMRLAAAQRNLARIRSESAGVFDDVSDAIEEQRVAARRDAMIEGNRPSQSGAITPRSSPGSNRANPSSARQGSESATDRFIETLQREVAAIGQSELARRQLEVRQALAMAQTDEERLRIIELSEARERALGIEERAAQVADVRQQSGALAGEVAALEREVQLLGEVGWARERRLLQLQREAELAPVLAQLAAAEAAGNQALADALREQVDLLQQKYGLQIQTGNAAEAMEVEAGAVAAVAESYAHLDRMAVSALSDIALHGQSASDVMKRLALSLADAAIEAALLGTGPLAGILGGGGQQGSGGQQGGGLGGLLSSLFTSAASSFGGPRASGGPVSPGKFYAVNERSTAPGLFIPLSPGRIDAPGNDNGGSRSAARSAPIMFDLRGAVMTEDLMRQMQTIANQSATGSLQAYDRALGGRMADHQARFG